MLKGILYVLPVSVASALAVFLLVGSGLSSLAQTSSESIESSSGTINSLVQEDGETTYILGGEWSLSIDSDEISDFKADLVMAKSDGTGAHEHEIVMAGESTINLAEERHGVEVTLIPTEQTVGGTVLVNASGLDANSDTVVKIGDMTAGSTQSDVNGNVLFALGISDDMTGDQTVTVEDATDSGTARLSVLEVENATSTGPANLTSTEKAENVTDLQSGNQTETESAGNQTIYNTTIEGQVYESEEVGDNPSASSVENSTDFNANGDLTTFEEEAIAAGAVFEDMESFNSTSDSLDATSTDSVSPTDAEMNVTRSFEFMADIYTDDELKWEDVRVTVTLMNAGVVLIEIDPAATENHFGAQPIYGLTNN